MFVWMVDCYLFYFTDTGLGEGLTKYSLLQVSSLDSLAKCVIHTLSQESGINLTLLHTTIRIFGLQVG